MNYCLDMKIGFSQNRQLNSTQLNSTQLNSTQLNSTQLNSTQLGINYRYTRYFSRVRYFKSKKNLKLEKRPFSKARKYLAIWTFYILNLSSRLKSA